MTRHEEKRNTTWCDKGKNGEKMGEEPDHRRGMTRELPALYSNEMAGKRLHAHATSVIWDLGGLGSGSSTWLPITQAARY